MRIPSLKKVKIDSHYFWKYPGKLTIIFKQLYDYWSPRKSCHWFQYEQKRWVIVKDYPLNSSCPNEVSTVQVFPFPDNPCPKRNDLPSCAAWEQNKSRGKKKVKCYFQSSAYQRLSACLTSDIYTSDCDGYHRHQTTPIEWELQI